MQLDEVVDQKTAEQFAVILWGAGAFAELGNQGSFTYNVGTRSGIIKGNSDINWQAAFTDALQK